MVTENKTKKAKAYMRRLVKKISMAQITVPPETENQGLGMFAEPYVNQENQIENLTQEYVRRKTRSRG